MKIAFIGLGHMGLPMVKNLLKNKYTVYVFDVLEKNIQEAVAEGALAMKTHAEKIGECDIVMTMVQTGQQVMDICLGDNGIFEHLEKNHIYIDSSSIDILTSHKLHEEAVKHGLYMLDAPVSGGVVGAIAGSLTFMVGGSKNTFEVAKPVLSAMGKKIIYAGNAGNGQAAKICNNLLLGISMIGTSEAFILAEKLGLEAKTFFEISSNASGQCWSMTQYCPVPGIVPTAPSNKNYEPGFTAKMMLKDLRLGQHAAEYVGASIPLGAAAAELYELFVNNGFAEKDFSAIIQLIKGRALLH